MNPKLQARLIGLQETTVDELVNAVRRKVRDLNGHTADVVERQYDMHVSLFKTIKANVDNEKLTDAEFRQFVRNSLPLIKD